MLSPQVSLFIIHLSQKLGISKPRKIGKAGRPLKLRPAWSPYQVRGLEVGQGYTDCLKNKAQTRSTVVYLYKGKRA